MRVLIGACGTRGDMQPMLALSQVLIDRGHSVTLVISPSAVDFARERGFTAIAAGSDYEEVARAGVSNSLPRMMREMVPRVRGEVSAQLLAVEEHAAQFDVITGASVFSVGSLLAEKLSKPYVYFGFSPQLFRSAEHPSVYVPWQGLPRWANWLSSFIDVWTWQSVLGPALNQLRVERGLAPVRDVWRALTGPSPVAAFERALAPAPADYPVPITQVGAMFLRDQGALSPEVSAFLAKGPPPVYIGFGSMADPDPRRTTERVLEAVRRAGVRAVVSRGWARLSAEAPSADVLFLGSEPHDQLFPRCAAVVHHGGSGTIHAAARAGVPQVVMPQMLDQFYWAHRVWRLGIGPRRVTRFSRDPEPLVRAIRACLDDPALRARAREVGESIRMDGAERAAALLERIARA